MASNPERPEGPSRQQIADTLRRLMTNDILPSMEFGSPLGRHVATTLNASAYHIRRLGPEFSGIAEDVEIAGKHVRSLQEKNKPLSSSPMRHTLAQYIVRATHTLDGV